MATLFSLTTTVLLVLKDSFKAGRFLDVCVFCFKWALGEGKMLRQCCQSSPHEGQGPKSGNLTLLQWTLQDG